MKRDEKACPRCAETIKKAAHLCKHCGHRFPEVQAKAYGQPNYDQAKEARNFKLGLAVCVIGAIALVSHCSKGTPDRSADATSSPSAANVFADESKQALWIVRSQDRIRTRLKDPASAKFKDTHFFSGGPTAVVCGRVNAKNAFGGYGGFERFIASGETMAFLESDMASPAEMDDVWNKMCVSAPTDAAYVP